LASHRCARDDYSEGILLDANENSYGPTVEGSTVELSVEDLQLNRYPDPAQASNQYRSSSQLEVKKLLCGLKDNGITPANIFVGVGSDEAIDILMRIFCAPGKDSILVTPPTYGMYKVCAKVNDVAVQMVPLTPEFDVVVSDVLRAVKPSTKLLFLCSPGNPTGVVVPLQVVRDIHAAYDGIIVVDEAYIDFASQPSACDLVAEGLDRVVVLQTLSKAWGMAAIRMG
ncbi:unnamed protein product, partial [Chrysoparadoxa australica]